ncbi:hypothetical protein ADJ77_11245 [Prevotella fusca JCM 17724]|uniref:Uncharacterized protein n=1 Tax=Prevotella fusca JCM 17724 TaxID=1236517 RepID=A0A0K1NN60_9BACT|nr:hypothetical protein ADJ77_11245 [Prevotella fusca JCM 17724]
MYSSILFSCLLCHFGVVIVSANQIGLYYYEALVMIYRALVMMLSAIWKSVKNYVAVMLNVGVPCMGTETAGVWFYMFQSEYDK